MIKGVFFDLGGTLRICDPLPWHQAAARTRMGTNSPAASFRYRVRSLARVSGVSHQLSSRRVPRTPWVDTAFPHYDTGSVLERVSRQKFTHVGFAGIDCRRIMDDTIHDGVSDYPAAKAWVPFSGFVLCAEDRRPLIVSALEDFQKIFVWVVSRILFTD